METKKEIILDTDDSAAVLKTVTGWVSRDGRFFGQNEQLARYSGSTHKTCSCGKIMQRDRVVCESCYASKEQERYETLPYKEWDGSTPLCIYNDDTYFFYTEDIEEYCEEREIETTDLNLVICTPNKFRKIDSEYWEEVLPDDVELPKEFKAKLDELNSFIETLPAISWSPSRVRTAYIKD